MKNLSARAPIVLALALALAMLALGSAVQAAVVSLPPGADALAAAIAAAGPGGTVLVEPGVHTESGTVTVGIPVSIVGSEGAILEIATVPELTPEGFSVITAGLHVLGASDVSIEGLEIQPPAGTIGNTAILVESADNARISGNHVIEHQFSVLVQHGNRVQIAGNTLEASFAWATTGEIAESEAIIIINGEFARIEDNTVSNALLGIFASDRKGQLARNRLIGNYIGVILCNVPQALVISDTVVGSEVRATEWQMHNNVAEGNFDSAYLVIDGANHNVLANNAASGSGRVDIDLAGDSERFGFLTPTAVDNVVAVGDDSEITVLDCAEGSIISGNANLVDPTPPGTCF